MPFPKIVEFDKRDHSATWVINFTKGEFYQMLYGWNIGAVVQIYRSNHMRPSCKDLSQQIPRGQKLDKIILSQFNFSALLNQKNRTILA